MDGSENDENKNLDSSAQQGIFSTPELTVDAEKLSQDTEAAKEASRAKIASIFANTETGQQAQRLNDAMEANAEPITEDIVINNGVKKKKKWPIVVGVLVVVAAVVGVGTWLFVQSLGGQVKETPLEAFNKYLALAKDGPENKPSGDAEAGSANMPSNKWFLREVSNAGLQKNEAESYLQAVESAYARFYELYSKDSNSQMTLTNKYREILNVYVDLNSTARLADELASKFLDDSPNAAYNYVQSFSDTDSMTVLEKDGVNQLRAYLEAELSMLSISDTSGCVAEGVLDTSCRANLVETSEAYREPLQEQQQASQNMATVSMTLGKLLQDQALVLQKEVNNEG